MHARAADLRLDPSARVHEFRLCFGLGECGKSAMAQGVRPNLYAALCKTTAFLPAEGAGPGCVDPARDDEDDGGYALLGENGKCVVENTLIAVVEGEAGAALLGVSISKAAQRIREPDDGAQSAKVSELTLKGAAFTGTHVVVEQEEDATWRSARRLSTR